MAESNRSSPSSQVKMMPSALNNPSSSDHYPESTDDEPLDDEYMYDDDYAFLSVPTRSPPAAHLYRSAESRGNPPPRKPAGSVSNGHKHQSLKRSGRSSKRGSTSSLSAANPNFGDSNSERVTPRNAAEHAAAQHEAEARLRRLSTASVSSVTEEEVESWRSHWDVPNDGEALVHGAALFGSLRACRSCRAVYAMPELASYCIWLRCLPRLAAFYKSRLIWNNWSYLATGSNGGCTLEWYRRGGCLDSAWVFRTLQAHEP